MSRDRASKARLEKPSKTMQNAPTPTVSEIIPGKLNEADWMSIMDHDEGNMYVTDVVQEVLHTTLGFAYEKYLQRQLVPFTVAHARNSLVHLIEWEFLTKDPGEWDLPNDASWRLDEEPEVPVIDCWAEGAMEKLTRAVVSSEADLAAAMSPVSDSGKTSSLGAELFGDAEGAADENEPDSGEAANSDGAAEVDSEAMAAAEKAATGVVTSKASSRPRPPLSLRRTFYKPQLLSEPSGEALPPSPPAVHKANMPSFRRALLRQQTGRPPGDKEVEYDHYGNVVRIAAIGSERLPRHLINTRFTVIDPAVEQEQRRLDAMRRGQAVGVKPQLSQAYHRHQHMEDFLLNGLKNARVSYVRPPRLMKLPADRAPNPLPSPIFDQCDVTPGVVLREGDRVKKGHMRRLKQFDVLSRKDLDSLNFVNDAPRNKLPDRVDIVDPNQDIVIRSSEPVANFVYSH